MRDAAEYEHEDGVPLQAPEPLPVPGPGQILPGLGFAHAGCSTCGNVVIVPLNAGEQLPWCPHVANRYVWHDPQPETQQSAEAWTRMIKVTVKAAR